MQPSCTVQLLHWSEALPLARAIRRTVFIEEQGIPEDMEWDEWDAVSIHAIATTGLAVGTGRLLPTDATGSARLGRMAVLMEWRDRGVGAAILGALLAEAQQRAVREIVLHAQVSAAAFYGRHGFIARGGTFLEAGVPHVEMRLQLRDSSPWSAGIDN